MTQLIDPKQLDKLEAFMNKYGNVSYVMSNEVTRWVNDKLIPMLDAVGMAVLHDGQLIKMKLNDTHGIEYEYDSDGNKYIKKWKFENATSSWHELEIEIEQPDAVSEAYIDRGIPFERSRSTEAAIDLLVDNKGSTAITKSVSRAVETSVDSFHQSVEDLHWDTSIGVQFGVQGTESNYGATALTTFNADIGQSRQKTVGDSQSVTTTRYVSDTVIVPGYSKYNILGTYDKVELVVPYKIRTPFDFKIKIKKFSPGIYNATVYNFFHKILSEPETSGVGFSVDYNDWRSNELNFTGIDELSRFYTNTMMTRPDLESVILPAEGETSTAYESFGLARSDLEVVSVSYDHNGFDITNENQRSDAEAYSQNRFAASIAAVLNNGQINKLIDKLETLKDNGYLHLERAGEFVYKDATDVTITAVELGTYDGQGSGSDYTTNNEADEGQKPSWSGDPIAQ